MFGELIVSQTGNKIKEKENKVRIWVYTHFFIHRYITAGKEHSYNQFLLTKYSQASPQPLHTLPRAPNSNARENKQGDYAESTPTYQLEKGNVSTGKEAIVLHLSMSVYTSEYMSEYLSPVWF